jgi:outer membrane protein assembly factor BamE
VQVIDMSHRNNIHCLILVFLSVFVVSACESWLPDAHSPDYTLGNVIKPDALEKIQLGMNKSEIAPILGNPMLTDPFHANRWDYVYRYIPGGRTDETPIKSRVTLYFEDDVLVKIDDANYAEPKSDNEKKEE